ncbi:MAG: hypothetical protein N0A16_00060 [Blastocatellia bacterium]|nr:hypothetical protein [Blastocatellia bacterium]MCS7156103.1 hypothetical protein [Blastocatellia bacterium]MDW8169260.1 hypothetical protein [Acidobacteriota bacterium]MDW8256119.1 hypothetical protein [Acidobacteriota bacterium]
MSEERDFVPVGLDLTDDDIHAIGPEPWWREAWYFEFFDPARRLQFQVYQGVFPNAGRGDLTLYVFTDGRPGYELMKMDYAIPSDVGRERLCFGPLKLEMLEPFVRWRLQYDSPRLQFDLTFRAIHRAFSWAEAKLWMEEAPVGEQSRHFDQVGWYEGWMNLDGEEIDIAALGMRDRMWGWGARALWRGYLVLWVPFSPSLVVNVAAMNFADGRRQLCGYIHQDRERALLRSARLAITWSERRWKSIERVEVRVTDARGRSLALSARPLGIIDTSHHWPHRFDHLLFSIGEYDVQGTKGYGCLTWSFVTADERPSVIEF